MAVGSNARLYPTDQVHYIRKVVTFEDDGTDVVVGTIPAEAIIIKAISGVNTTTAFDAGTTNTINVGYAAYVDGSGSDVSADPDAFATLLDVSGTGYDNLDEAAADFYADANKAGVTVTAGVVLTGTAATAGSAVVTIAYTVAQPGIAQ